MAIGLANNIKLRSMQLQNLDIRDMDAANDGYVRTAYAATVGKGDGVTRLGNRYSTILAGVIGLIQRSDILTIDSRD